MIQPQVFCFRPGQEDSLALPCARDWYFGVVDYDFYCVSCCGTESGVVAARSHCGFEFDSDSDSGCGWSFEFGCDSDSDCDCGCGCGCGCGGCGVCDSDFVFDCGADDVGSHSDCDFCLYLYLCDDLRLLRDCVIDSVCCVDPDCGSVRKFGRDGAGFDF